MNEIVIPRRRFLTGLVGLLAAPAVVRIESLMPVKALPVETPLSELLAFDPPMHATLKELARLQAILVDHYRGIWQELATGRMLTATDMLMRRDEKLALLGLK